MKSKVTKNAVPYYLQIREEIIENLKKDPNYSIPSENQLCKVYGVSRPTVRKALEYLVEKRLVVRKRGKGTFPILTQKTTIKKKEDTILIVLHEDWDIKKLEEYLSEIIKGIFWGNRDKKVDLKIVNFSYLDFYERFKEWNINYSLWISPEKEEKVIMEKLANEGYFVVALNRRIDTPNISYVSCNHFKGGIMGTEYLFSHGHRKICFVALVESLSFLYERYKGFCETYLKYGYSPYESTKIVFDEDDIEKIKKELEEVISKNRPTALFLGAGIYQKPVLEVLEKMKLKIPEDISIISFDKFSEITEKYSLTYIKQPIEEIGKIAVEKVIENMEKMENRTFKILLDPEIKEGFSVRGIE